MSSTSSGILTRKQSFIHQSAPSAGPSSQPMVQQSTQQAASYNGQGSIATMQELYEVGEVIGTGTFGIIRKASPFTFQTRPSSGLNFDFVSDCLHRSCARQMDW